MKNDLYKDLIENLTKRTGMYVRVNKHKNSYESLCNYIHGFDHGVNGRMLFGFYEWLCMRFNKNFNTVFENIIMIKITNKYKLDELTPEENKKCINELRKLLFEFFDYRSQFNIRNIIYDYGVWKRKFDWFNEDVERYGTDNPKKIKEIKNKFKIK